MKFPGGSRVLRGRALKAADADQRTVAISGGMGAFAREPVGAHGAFAALLPQLQQSAARWGEGACLLGVVDVSGEVVASTVLKPGDAATIGRHSQCRLRLREPDVSLRHLVAHVGQRSSAGLPMLRLWDLKTRKAFAAEDGESTEALAATGPVFATLGSYSLGLIPLHYGDGTWPADVEAAWERLPPREFIARLAEGTNADRQNGPHSATRVTHLHSTCSFDELSDPHLAVAELHVVSRDRRRKYYLQAKHLERGILVGRYSRCCSDAIRDPAVSRVHLLLAASGREVYAIDTASTCGVRDEAGEPIVSRPLPERAVLTLGDQTTLVWKRRALSKA
jgi:hypothetical protein